MIPVTLELKDKKVVIAGGGKVAHRKALSYLKQKARVTIVSPELSFDAGQMTWLKQKYDVRCLEGAFVVYAATDDKKVNHQIVMDCSARNILCGSATYESEATLHGMSWQENEFGLVAVSSLGRLPYQKPLLAQLNEVVEKNWDRLDLLVQLRPYVIKEAISVQKWFETGYSCPVEWLKFLVDAYACKTGRLFVYHQSDFQKEIQLPVSHSLVISLKEYEAMGHFFDLSVIQIIPLVLTRGRIYDRIAQVNPHKRIEDALLENTDLTEFASSLMKTGVNNLVVLHPRGTSELKVQIEKETGLSVVTFDDELHLSDRTHLSVWLITHGKHYDEFEKKLLLLQESGVSLTYSRPLVEEEAVMSFLKKKYEMECS